MKGGPALRGPAWRGPTWRGPAWLVTAAFLGPGTLTTATLAGQATGLGLLWALVLSLALTAGLQLLLAQLVINRRRDLGALIRETLEPPGLRWFSVILTALAIGFGNAAYQAGNLTGAALGLGAWLPLPPYLLGPGLAALAALLLLTPLRARLEGLLLGLIAVMAAVFCLAALASLGAGMPPLTLSAPTGQAGALALALLGTTVVPYNLFLHGRALLDRLPPPEERGSRADAALHQDARRDTLRAIAVGGLVTGAILLLAAGNSAEGSSVERLAAPLEPLLGAGAEPFLALGLFAAGLSSALTAPLAAAWALAGLFRWGPTLEDPRPRLTAFVVLAVGALGAALGGQPLQMILLAQGANALALPWFAFLLLRLATLRSQSALLRLGPWLVLAGALGLGSARFFALL